MKQPEQDAINFYEEEAEVEKAWNSILEHFASNRWRLNENRVKEILRELAKRK